MEQLGEGVQVSVAMGEVRLIKVFLAGEFRNPESDYYQQLVP